jgi:FkbM family methyltransferase
MMTGKKLGVSLLLLAIGVPVCVVLASAATGGRLHLQVEHQIRTMLGDDTVATLEIGETGKIKMFLNPDDEMVTVRIAAERIWEPNETFWFLRAVKEGQVVVDIGANVGYYTLLGGAVVGEKGRIYAFEPDPVGFGILEKNVRLNGLTNVVLEQKAVSSESGSIRLFLADENKGDHRTYQTDEERESIEVGALALDDYFEGYEGSIDFVKIDTQGAEAAIVEGMDQLIKEHEEMRMVVEFWPYGLDMFGADSDELLEKLQSYGFEFYNLGVWGQPSRLMKVSIAGLSERHTVETQSFTNLFLMRPNAKGTASGVQ